MVFEKSRKRAHEITVKSKPYQWDKFTSNTKLHWNAEKFYRGTRPLKQRIVDKSFTGFPKIVETTTAKQ